ncbi:hypothetical protein D3C85_244930 [compost metagenome]
MATSAEMLAALSLQFGKYKAQVYRLIKSKAGHVRESLDTEKLTGLTLADILAIIKGEINSHETTKPSSHGETLAQLGGMAKSTYDAKSAVYFPKDAFPLSKVPLIAASVGASNLNLPATEVIFNGRKVTVPSAVIVLGAGTKYYVKITFTGEPPAVAGKFSAEADASEGQYEFVVGIATKTGATWAVAMERAARIGYFPITDIPRGQGIPHSTGTQAAPGTLPSTWFQ